MPYHHLYYHLVWSTKHRQPILTPAIEPIVYNLLRTKAIGLGATVFALNGDETHVHMVASIPPAIAVAKFVGQVKATTSTRFNKSGHGVTFYWQEEYGAFTFDKKRLPNYIAYVERQKEHHAHGTLLAILERTEEQAVSLHHVQEFPANYIFEEEGWRNEMVELSDRLPG